MDRAALRVGVLTPHAAAGPEVELPDMAPGRIAVVVARVRSDAAAISPPPTTAAGLRVLAEPEALHQAATPLSNGSVDVVAFASTSTGYVLGHRAEAALAEDLAHWCGVPVVASGSSAVDALRAAGSRRIAVLHPPWFDDEIDELGTAYFRAQGLEVSLYKLRGLPDDPERVQPGAVVDWVTRHVGDEADALFFGGNGLRAARAIEELERRTGRLVLQANQVLLWSILAATGTAWTVSGYGRLFDLPPATTRFDHDRDALG